MKRFLMLVVMLVPLAAAGCGQPQLVAEAAISDGETGERLALGDLPIRVLPYDRDAIFDSLEQAYPEPEPPIPAEILEQQAQIQQAEAEWSAAEERWATIRDSLRVLFEETERMRQQNMRGTPQYARLYEQYEALDSQEQQIDRQRQAAFDRFTQLQAQTLAVADSIRIQRELWADEAFADFNRIVAQKLSESGREEYADTTDARGIASFRLPEGRWWVYARYPLPFEELYWNIPVEVTGDSTHIGLTSENAEERPVL